MQFHFQRSGDTGFTNVNSRAHVSRGSRQDIRSSDPERKFFPPGHSPLGMWGIYCPCSFTCSVPPCECDSCTETNSGSSCCAHSMCSLHAQIVFRCIRGTYTFTITAANGVSPAATQSFTLTVVDVPGAPTAVSAYPGNGFATISWTAPSANGGQTTLAILLRQPLGEVRAHGQLDH